MKYTLSIALFSALLLMGASCGKTADTTTNTTESAIANAQAAASVTTNSTNTAVNTTTPTNTNTNKTAGVTTTTNDAQAGLEEPAAAASGISASDIAKHNTKSDCWTSISGKVYDVTKYIAKHPGGQVITQICGKEGTQLFATQGGRGQHSGTARSQLATFEIGTLQ